MTNQTVKCSIEHSHDNTDHKNDDYNTEEMMLLYSIFKSSRVYFYSNQLFVIFTSTATMSRINPNMVVDIAIHSEHNHLQMINNYNIMFIS